MKAEKRKRGSKVVRVTLSGEALTRGHPLVRATLLDDQGPQPLPRGEEGSEALFPHRFEV